MFASLVAALVVPVGYALSVESNPAASYARYAVIVPGGSAAVVPVGVAAVTAPMTIDMTSTAPAALRPITDSAKLFGIGTLLIGLAAVLRKAI
jgi:hypothetical protein